MATPDDRDNSRRALALLAARRTLPDELRDWLASLLHGVVAGRVLIATDDSPPAVLHVARRARRDAAIRAVYAMATGSALDRGEAVLGWHDAHQDGAPVPAPVADHLADADAAGVPFPQSWRQIVRIAAGR